MTDFTRAETNHHAMDELETEEIARVLAELTQSGGWAVYEGRYIDRLKSWLSTSLRRPIGGQFVAPNEVFPCSSGSVGIELALHGIKLSPGDEVILGQYDYPGNHRAIEGMGGKPVAVSLQSDRWTIDPTAVQSAITSKSRGIIASHLHGLMADVATLREIADQHGLVLIEDACQGIGGSISNRPAGAWGHISVFSFGGSKLVTAGCGGAVVCEEPKAAQRIRLLQYRPSPTHALSELQAAVICPQLVNLKSRHQRRRAAVTVLLEQLSSLIANQDERFRWRLPTRSEFDLDAGDYKFGWFVPAFMRSALIDRGKQLNLPLGTGFNVFKRHAHGAINQALIVQDELVLLDHRALSDFELVLKKLGSLALESGS
jgi:dTDP-4-amino-4,6-dideoxygalactose transaminase